MKSENISKTKKKFHNEWLLIAVDTMDKSTTTPKSGTLIAHSPNREKIYRQLMKPLPHKRMLVEYSEDSFPKGVAAAF